MLYKKVPDRTPSGFRFYYEFNCNRFINKELGAILTVASFFGTGLAFTISSTGYKI